MNETPDTRGPDKPPVTRTDVDAWRDALLGNTTPRPLVRTDFEPWHHEVVDADAARQPAPVAPDGGGGTKSSLVPPRDCAGGGVPLPPGAREGGSRAHSLSHSPFPFPHSHSPNPPSHSPHTIPINNAKNALNRDMDKAQINQWVERFLGAPLRPWQERVLAGVPTPNPPTPHPGLYRVAPAVARGATAGVVLIDEAGHHYVTVDDAHEIRRRLRRGGGGLA